MKKITNEKIVAFIQRKVPKAQSLSIRPFTQKTEIWIPLENKRVRPSKKFKERIAAKVEKRFNVVRVWITLRGNQYGYRVILKPNWKKKTFAAQ